MGTKKKYQQELEPGKFYHIFNRGNNSGKIFFGQDKTSFFFVGITNIYPAVLTRMRFVYCQTIFIFW